MTCRNGKCDLTENPSSGSGYAWRCIKCGFTIPINNETYRLFYPKLRCPKCAWDLIVVVSKGGEHHG